MEFLSEYIFLISIKNKQNKNKKTQKKVKEEKRISVRYLTRYDNIVCEYAMYFYLTYLFKSRISGCSYKFNLVYVEREKSQYLLYYNMEYTLS